MSDISQSTRIENALNFLLEQIGDLSARVQENAIHINKISSTMDILSTRLDVITTTLDKIEGQSDKMTDHVDFVNGVYDNVKTPFHKIMNIVSYTSDSVDDVIASQSQLEF